MNKRCLVAISILMFLLVTASCSRTAPAAITAPTVAPTPVAKTTASAPPASSPKVKSTLPKPAPSAVSFAGKTVTIIVFTSAGGGSDVTARLYARYLGRFLPGNPSVIVRNMPGGEGTVALNFAYLSKPDGLTVLLAAGTAYMADLLDKPALKFASLTEMTAIIAVPPVGDLYYFKPGIFDKPEDIVNAKGVIYGQTAGTVTMMFLAVKEFINIPTEKVITAYGSSGDSRRAFLSGEINGSSDTTASWESFILPLSQKGELKVLFQAGMVDKAGKIVRHPGFRGDIMTAPELYEKLNGKSPSGPGYEAYRQLLGSLRGMERTLLLPPGTPDDIKRAYFAAADNMVKDQGFLKDATSVLGESGEWRAGETMDRIFKQQFRLDPEIRTWLANLLSTKYGMVLE